MQFVSDSFVKNMVYEHTAPGGYQFYGTATLEQLMNVSLFKADEKLEQTEKLRFENKGTQDMYINWQAPQTLWPQTLKISPGEGAEYAIPSGSLPATRFWPKYDCDSTG